MITVYDKHCDFIPHTFGQIVRVRGKDCGNLMAVIIGPLQK